MKSSESRCAEHRGVRFESTLVGAPVELAQQLAKLAQTNSSPVPLQLEYIAHYAFRDLAARRFVIEAPYVDRHYMEEFAGH